MRTILENIKREPALLVALVVEVLTLGTLFGLPLTEVQQGAIISTLMAAGAILVRQSVTPNASVAIRMDEYIGRARDEDGNGIPDRLE